MEGDKGSFDNIATKDRSIHPGSYLDPHDPLPLWAQLARLLRYRIQSGDYAEHFPSESELANTFEVSRATVRESIRRLKEEGFLISRRGLGTFVNSWDSDIVQSTSYSLAKVISARGMEETSQVLELRILRDAPREVFDWLEIAENEELVFVERIRLGSGVPLALDRSYLPASLAKAIVGADLSKGSLYEVLHQYCGTVITGGFQQLKAVSIGERGAALLEIDPQGPVLEVQRVAYAYELPAEYRVTLFAGDRLHFQATWGESRNSAPY